MDTAKKQKYFVNQQEAVAIQCRHCGRVETIPVESLRNSKHSVQVNCACKKTFDVDLEFRKDFRKRTSISATFRALTTPKTRARRCIIADQSDGGLLLHINEEVPVKANDQLVVSIPADNITYRETERVLSVRHYEMGFRIGGAFIDDSTRFEANLPPVLSH